jgi:hypothetical protein
MKRLASLLAAIAAIVLSVIVPSAASRAPRVADEAQTIDQLISACPSADEVAQIRADFSLAFEGDPTAGTLVCRAADGSADLTRLQERAIQALRAMKALSFARPLPWTSHGLYEWLQGAIDGIRFRTDIPLSFCCDPAGVIDIRADNLWAVQTGRWTDPRGGSGLDSLVALYVHEARHNERRPHTCGTGDATLTELGAWGAQYYYYLWLGLYAGRFLATTSPSATYNRDQALHNSEHTLSRICSTAASDLTLSVETPPATVPPGGRLVTRLTVRNLGPRYAPEAYVAFDETPGVALVQSASASRGSCVVGAEGEPRGTACALGQLDPGQQATITIVQRVTGKVGDVVRAPASSLSLGPYVTGPVEDPVRGNNTASFSVAIAPGAAPPTCSGTPRGGVKRTGPSGGGRVVGTSRGDVLCSGGGVTTLDGRGGDDVLRGGPERDRVLAGPGNDTAYVGGGGADSVTCGPGRDRVFADRADRVARDCERITRT